MRRTTTRGSTLLALLPATSQARAASGRTAISPNRSIPGTEQFARVPGGVMTVGLIAASPGRLVSLAGIGLAGDTHRFWVRASLPRVRRCRALLAAFAAAVVWPASAAADGAVPTVTPNRSIPGTDALTRLAGGLMTLGLIGAGVGLVVSLGGLAIAGHTHNIHLRERFKTGVLLSLVATVGFGAANRLLAWAFGIGGGF